MRTFEYLNNEKKEIMNKKETTIVYTALASSQGAQGPRYDVWRKRFREGSTHEKKCVR